MKKRVLGIRISDELRKDLEMRAGRENLSVSAFAAKLLEESLSETSRIDLLVRNIHEECLTIEDMLTIMQGFNKEVYKTILARTDKPLDAEQKKEMGEYRKKAEKGLNDYLDRVFKKIIAEENIWQCADEINEKKA